MKTEKYILSVDYDHRDVIQDELEKLGISVYAIAPFYNLYTVVFYVMANIKQLRSLNTKYYYNINYYKRVDKSTIGKEKN